MKSIEGHRADEVNKMQLLLDQVEAVKDHVRQLAEEIDGPSSYNSGRT